MQQPVPPTYQALLQPISSMTTQYPVGDVSNGFGFDMPFSLPSANTSGITPIHHSPFAHLPMATPSSTPAAAPYIPRSPAPTTAPTKQQDMAALASLLQQIEQLRGANHDSRQAKDLTTSEVAAYTTTLNRVGLYAWLARFVHLVNNKNLKVAELLCMRVSQAQSAIKQDIQLQLADAYLSRQIDCVLDATSHRVQAFKMKLDNNLEAAASGVLKLAYIREMCVLSRGVEVRLAEREFEEKAFFRSYMPRDEAIKAAWELTSEFKLLKRCYDDESIMFEILKKMPERVALRADTLFEDISRGQITGCSPFTLDQLIEIVSIMLSSDEGAGGFRRMQTRRQGTKKSASRPPANKAKVKTNVAASERRTKNLKWRAEVGSINKTTGTQVSNGGARSGYNSNSNAEELNAAKDGSNREQGVRYVSRCEAMAEYAESDDEQCFPATRICTAQRRIKNRGETLAALVASVLTVLMLIVTYLAPGVTSETHLQQDRQVNYLDRSSRMHQHKIEVKFMIDGGSNTNLVKIERVHAERLGLSEDCQRNSTITGFAVGSATTSQGTLCTTVRFSDKEAIDVVDACYMPDARHSILSESYLIDKGIQIVKDKHEQVLIFPSGNKVHLERENGLYFCNATLEAFNPLTTSMSSLRVDDRALLWAARLNVGAKGLTKISGAVRGIDVDTISEQAADAIDHDQFRRLQCSKKKPVGRTLVRDLAERPGEVFICDGFGKHSAASPLDGAVYQLHAVDEYTNFGYVKSVSTHTIDDWMDFLREVALDARANGHSPKMFRFDQAPELRSDSLRKRVNQELDMHVELTPRSHHEGVGRVEINNDILTRQGEAMCQRAEKGTAYLLPARAYAQANLNFKPYGNNTVSRFQEYYGKVPSFDDRRPPYLFGTHVLFHEEKEARGPKGSLFKPRASRGMIVGVQGRRGASGDVAYLVMRDGGGVVSPRHVDPLDEIQLLRRGLPSGAARNDAATQTPPLGEVLTKPAIRKTPIIIPTVELPIGTRFGMMWYPEKGMAKREYPGTIVEEIKRANHPVMYRVQYDDYADPMYHDFARTKRQWRVISKPSSEPSKNAVPPMAHIRATGERGQSAGGTLTRSRAKASLEDKAVEASKANASNLETNKATQNVIDVSTDIGVAQYRVPATKREVSESPQCEEWMEAERKALDAILRAGNRLVPRWIPEKKGVPIARTVTARRLKIDPATGKLAEKNAFKSRHNVDGGYLKVQEEQLARSQSHNGEDQVPATSTVVDDMTMKLFLGFAAKHDLELTKGDVGNAYAKGTSKRDLGYMELPSTLKMVDEDGSPLCIELHTPMWGEREAGYEWQCTFTDCATKMGWKKCEGVPAMYTFQKPDGGIAAMITIVDDFLIAESNTDITDATLAKLKEQFEELAVQRNPDSFSGYKVSRDRKTRAITLSMPQKIIEATRTHLPEALDGEGKVKVLKGGKLADVADGLELDQASKETKKLDAQQKTTQSIIGSLKFVEKIMPEISVALHRLSCVMSAPPVEALAVAKGVLHYAYLHKTNGITYGGTNGDEEYNEEHVGIEGRAPIELSATADATWGDGRNIYGLLVTYNRGSIAHMTKKIRAIVESSHHSEAIATSEATKQVMYAREVLRALHEPQRMATKIATDNRANLLVANDATSAKRARHFLRQYHILQQRIESDEIAVCKLPTSVMPADFLTKWIAGNKVKKSTEYATNSTAYVNS